MLRVKSADTYMQAVHVSFQVKGGDIAPEAWINEITQNF